MSELEKGLKEQLESVIKQNQMLLKKHYQQDSKIVKLIEENNYYKNQLQQKENIIKEVRDILKRYICNPSGLKDGWHIDCWNSEDISKLNEDLGILDKENKHDD